MPDLPSWLLSCSSDLSAGTATSELLVLPNRGYLAMRRFFLIPAALSACAALALFSGAQQANKPRNDVNAFGWATYSTRRDFSTTAPAPKSLKDRKEKYGEYSVVHADYQMTHLWTTELAPGNAPAPEPKRLTEGDKFSV